MNHFIGEIKMLAGNHVPSGWLPCDGGLYPILGYEPLFCAIGAAYGGDKQTTFAVPDLRGRMPIGMGNGVAMSPRVIGEKGGEETHVLNESQMPSHAHDVAATGEVFPSAKNGAGDEVNPWGMYPASANEDLYATDANVTMGSSPVVVDVAEMQKGGSDPVNHMPPFIAVNFIICYQGIHPF